MSDINWNETAVYEFMRFEREPERRVFPDRDITKLAKPDSFRKTRRATGLSPKQAKTNSPTSDSISTPANSPNYP